MLQFGKNCEICFYPSFIYFRKYFKEIGMEGFQHK